MSRPPVHPGNQFNYRHGHRVGGIASPTYRSWRAMIDRCTRERHPHFPDYGGRGIQVDPSWRGRGGFARFLAHVGVRPDGMTLDRIDVNGHYAPGNVRWATIQVQRWNRRDMLERVPDAPESACIAPLMATDTTESTDGQDWGW